MEIIIIVFLFIIYIILNDLLVNIIKYVQSIICRVNHFYFQILFEETITIKSIVIIARGIYYLWLGTVTSRILSMYKLMKNNWILKVPIILVIFLVSFYIYGFIIYKISDLQSSLNIKNIKLNFAISNVILVVYLLIITKDIEMVYKYNLSIIILLIMSYLINIYILFRIMVETKNIFEKKIKGWVLLSFVIVGIIIINLFFLVTAVYYKDPLSFASNPKLFDLFYFTIVSFVTIGYGDIVPVSFAAKMISVIISFTSILCLSVFFSSFFSDKSK